MMAVVYLSGGVALLLVWWLNRTNPPRILKLIWQVDSVVEFSFAALMMQTCSCPHSIGGATGRSSRRWAR